MDSEEEERLLKRIHVLEAIMRQHYREIQTLIGHMNELNERQVVNYVDDHKAKIESLELKLDECDNRISYFVDAVKRLG